jgi:cysteine synthase A
VDAFCALVGTGGTFVGVARALKARNPAVRCYAVEPASAPVLAGKRVRNPRHKLQGGGYASVPPLWELAPCCDGFLTATDAEATRVARRLGREEGICAGFSSGANVAAALTLALDVKPGATIVTVIADTGLKYLSTDLFPA